MTSTHTILNDLARTRKVEEIVAAVTRRRTPSALDADCAQLIYMGLLQLPPGRVASLHASGTLHAYIVGMAKNMVHSRTSPLYYQYRIYYKHATPLSDNI